jgi:hypothetical protein
MPRWSLVVALLGIFAPGCDTRPAPAALRTASSTAPRDAPHDLIGTRLPDLHFDAWLAAAADEAPRTPAATLYRWWTDSCAYCEASLPAIEALRTRFERRGLRVVAVYHPKPPRDVSALTIRSAAERLFYHGLIAVDRDWSELTSFYLSTAERPATSASFLVDRGGIIRFVHPGPELRVSDAAYAELERAIERVLGPAGGVSG